MANHRFRVELRHARRTDHHRGRASLFRIAGVFDTGMQTFGTGSGDDGDSSTGVVDHSFEHDLALNVGEPRNLAGDAQRGYAIDTAVDKQIDDASHAFKIQLAVVVQGRGK